MQRRGTGNSRRGPGSRRRSPIWRWLGLAILIAIIIGAVAYLRQYSLPRLSAVLAYELKPGYDANYHIRLTLTNAVQGQGVSSLSTTHADVVTHQQVLSVDKSGAATMRVDFRQANVTVDGHPLTSPLAKLHSVTIVIKPNGQVQEVQIPAASQTLHVSVHSGVGRQQAVHQVITAPLATDQPLQSIASILQSGLPAFPDGTVNVGGSWVRSSVINAPYMLLMAAVSHSTLDGFERRGDTSIARIVTNASAPVDLVSTSGGSPVRLRGTERMDMRGFFAPDDHILVGTDGHVSLDLTQHPVSATVAGSASPSADVHSTVVMTFTADLQS